MKVAINTPNGKIGKVLTGLLLDAGADVVLLTRSPEKTKQFADRGAKIHVGDLEDADFVLNATKGADVLFWLTPPKMTSDDSRGYQNKLGDIAARAVAENKIPRVVNLSSIGAHLPSGTGPIVGLRDVERKLDKTGAHVTHIRAGFFMENLFMAAETIARDGAVYMPIRGSAGTAMIATSDIARAAAARILERGWTGRSVIELLGPAEITFEGAARTLGKSLGKEVTFVTTTPEKARQALVGMGIPPKTAELFVEMYTAFDAGKVVPETPKQARAAATTIGTFAEKVFRPGVEAMASARR